MLGRAPVGGVGPIRQNCADGARDAAARLPAKPDRRSKLQARKAAAARERLNTAAAAAAAAGPAEKKNKKKKKRRKGTPPAPPREGKADL